jgi:hypothetical protein
LFTEVAKQQSYPTKSITFPIFHFIMFTEVAKQQSYPTKSITLDIFHYIMFTETIGIALTLYEANISKYLESGRRFKPLVVEATGGHLIS